jgi:hypothetical protein
MINNTKTKQKQYRFKIKQLCKSRGIETAGALWVKAEGKFSSKDTTSKLWKDNRSMIRLDTINILCDLLSCEPKDLFEVIE